MKLFDDSMKKKRAIEFLRSNKPIVVDTTIFPKYAEYKYEFNPILDCLHYFKEGKEGLVVCGFDFSKPF